MPTPLDAVQVYCKEGCGNLHNRGWPRCGECKAKLRKLRQTAWAEFMELGRPGDWGTFFSMWSGRPMPAEPSFRIHEAGQIAAQTLRAIDPVFEWESSDP